MEPCKKVSYSSKGFADFDIIRISKKPGSHRKPIRSYFCVGCRTWHLTSQPPRFISEEKIQELNETIAYYQMQLEEITQKLREAENLEMQQANIVIRTDKRIKEMKTQLSNKTKTETSLRKTISNLVTQLNNPK